MKKTRIKKTPTPAASVSPEQSLVNADTCLSSAVWAMNEKKDPHHPLEMYDFAPGENFDTCIEQNVAAAMVYLANWKKKTTQGGQMERQITDRGLKALPTLVSLIQVECARQIEKWGIQDKTPFEWVTYTTEELGELAEAVTNFEYGRGRKRHVVAEAIETATLCLKIAEMYLEEEARYGKTAKMA